MPDMTGASQRSRKDKIADADASPGDWARDCNACGPVAATFSTSFLAYGAAAALSLVSAVARGMCTAALPQKLGVGRVAPSAIIPITRAGQAM